MSSLSRLLATFALVACAIVNADTYTGHIPSIEWKSYSSDAVLLVSVDSRANNVPKAKLLDVFHRREEELTDAESLVQSWKLPQLDEHNRDYRYDEGWRPDGEWLLFVRKWKDSEPTIDHVVYLQNPRQASWISAVNAKGQLLMEKQEILAVVKKRLEDGKKMTPRQRIARKLVDKGEHPKFDVNDYFSVDERIQMGVQPWVGGFQIPVNISVWDDYDDKQSFNEDLWIHSVIVPADESFREALFEQWTSYLQKSRELREHNVFAYPNLAFINYPGQKTEQMLMRMDDVNPPPASVPYSIAVDATLALEYLRFYESSFDEQDRQLLGSWELTTARERLQLDFLEDHQLIVHRKPIPFPSPNQFEEEWFAKGRWNLHYGRLYLLSKEYQISTGEMGVGRARLPALDEISIVQIAKDKITFDKGTVLLRTPEPIPKVKWIRKLR